MNVPENTISTYEIPTNLTQTEILSTKLNNEYMNLQTEYYTFIYNMNKRKKRFRNILPIPIRKSNFNNS